jgi:hypothetical protein
LYQLDKLTTLLQVVGKLVTSLASLLQVCSVLRRCAYVYCAAKVGSKVCTDELES